MKGRRNKRANPAVCWICGRKLACGGWQYVDVKDEAGNVHPAHRVCTERDLQERPL